MQLEKWKWARFVQKALPVYVPNKPNGSLVHSLAYCIIGPINRPFYGWTWTSLLECWYM